MNTEKLLINGNWIDGEYDNLQIISPWDQSEVGYVSSASKKQVEDSLISANDAFSSWRNTSVSAKIVVFEKIVNLLLAKKQELAELLSKEIGKTKEEAENEVSRSIDYIKLVMHALKHQTGKVYLGDVTGSFNKGRKTGIYTREPLGVILAISAFNYPLNLSITKIAPALLSGNTVVFKPALQGSLSAISFYKTFVEAGLPNGVLNILTGKTSEFGDFLVSHPLVKLIAFTGSTNVGKHIGKISTGIPLLLELGGKDIAIVTNNAEINIAVSEIVKGGFAYCGQRCTAQKMAFVYENIYEDFKNALTPLVKNLITIPMINSEAVDYVQELITDAIQNGGNFVVEGSRNNNSLDATVIEGVTPQMRLFQEEQFGPVLPIMVVKNESEAISLHKQLNFGLQASVYSQNIEEAFRIANQLEVGTVQINGKPDRGPDNFPFGGVGDSGQFMQGTIETLELMTRGKLTVINLHNF